MNGLYSQKCKVLRVQEVTDEWHETATEWVKVYDDVPCHLSQKILRPSDTKISASSRNDFKLFVPIHFVMLQSDRVIVEGKTYTTNEPMVYRRLKKQEILLTRVAE